MKNAKEIQNNKAQAQANVDVLISIIERLKEIDPIAAGNLHKSLKQQLSERVETTTVFTLGELEQYGYIPETYAN